jgi:hypothetical protein
MWGLSILLLKLNAQQSLRTWVLLMLRDSMSMKWERLMLTRSLLPTVAHRLSWVEHLVRTWSIRFSISMVPRSDDDDVLLINKDFI